MHLARSLVMTPKWVCRVFHCSQSRGLAWQRPSVSMWVPSTGLTALAHQRLPFILSGMVWLRMCGTLARSHQHVGSPYGTHSAHNGSHFAVM